MNCYKTIETKKMAYQKWLTIKEKSDKNYTGLKRILNMMLRTRKNKEWEKACGFQQSAEVWLVLKEMSENGMKTVNLVKLS